MYRQSPGKLLRHLQLATQNHTQRLPVAVSRLCVARHVWARCMLHSAMSGLRPAHCSSGLQLNADAPFGSVQTLRPAGKGQSHVHVVWHATADAHPMLFLVRLQVRLVSIVFWPCHTALLLLSSQAGQSTTCVLWPPRAGYGTMYVAGNGTPSRCRKAQLSGAHTEKLRLDSQHDGRLLPAWPMGAVRVWDRGPELDLGQPHSTHALQVEVDLHARRVIRVCKLSTCRADRAMACGG